MNTLGYRLLELLKAKDMTQKELAYTIGVSEVSISRYVNNARKPRAIVLYKMAEVLGVSVEYLLTGNKNMEIEDQPTAYDVEKVVKELEDLKMRYYFTIANTGDADKDCAYLNTANAIDKAIEIVKRGGVDEN